MNAHKTSVKIAEVPGRFLLPEIPEKHPDDMTSFKQLANGGNLRRMESYLGNPESTIVSGSATSAPSQVRRCAIRTCW